MEKHLSNGLILPLKWTEKIIVEEVGESLAIFNMETEAFFNLNFTASEMLKLLQNRSALQVIELLKEKYPDNDSTEIEKDVSETIRMFFKYGFIEEADNEDIAMGCN